MTKKRFFSTHEINKESGSFMKKKFIGLFISILMTAFAIFGVACTETSGSTSSSSESSSNELPTLEFVDKQIEILLGETRHLYVETLMEGETISYSSNDNEIVIVNEEGAVEGVGVGTTVVKAVTSNERTALVQITVHDPEFYPVPYILVDNDKVSLSVGNTFKVNYVCTYLGETLDVTAVMTSGNTSFVAVENGVISAVGVGETEVRLSCTTNVGTATKTIRVTVLEEQVEFYLSVSGKNIYAGKPMELVVYANERGTIKTIEDVNFSIDDTSIANIEGTVLDPQKGGDTTLVSTFVFNGQERTFSLPIHVYGLHTCTLKLMDGSTDKVIQAVYGDPIPLVLKNESGNPEYKKPIKSWYVDGKKFTEETFIMPDRDVELYAKFVNETEENFVDMFTEGHLLNDIRANVEYVNETLTDANGVSSDFDGYVKFTSPNWSSLVYNFDEAVVVSEFASVSMKIYLPQASELLYFGYASDEKWNASNPTRRYEAGRSSSGDVPHQTLKYEQWVILEMPLSAFANVGEKLNGISICVSSNSYILIDYISVNYGLAATDPIYQDNTLYKAITLAENGSVAQAEAISEYYTWSLTLTEAERVSQTHVANVADIKEIMTAHFDSNVVLSYDNIPKVTGNTNYTGDQVGTANCHTNYASGAYKHYYMTQFNSGSFDGKFTLNNFNYNAYGSVRFGLFAIASLNGKIIIGDESVSFDNSKEHYYKVVIQGGVLTLYDDSAAGNDGGGVVFTVTLDEAVANGTAELVIDFEFDGWSQGEITEGYTTISVNDII